MTYDFDTSVDRSRSNSLKWTKYPGAIPMWVADMDFRAPEPILAALERRVREDGVFGYEEPSNRLRSLIVMWLWRRYQWKIAENDLVFLPGLVSGLNVACRAFCERGDGALVLTPVYPPFRRAPKNNGLLLQEAPLARADRGEHVHYEIDFDAIIKTITPQTRLMMLCHPHNPIGQQFSETDRRRLGEICIEREIVVCSDEIHCDLMLGSSTHQPNALLSPEIADRMVTLMAPSKTFNLPGLGLGFAVVTNEQLRRRFRRAAFDIVPTPNVLALAAAESVYAGECDSWHEQLLAYLTGNRDELTAFVRDRLLGIKATMPTATYLGWLDCQNTGIAGNPFEFFLKNAKVSLAEGAEFGGDSGQCARINFGCPRGQLRAALERMAEALRPKPA